MAHFTADARKRSGRQALSQEPKRPCVSLPPASELTCMESCLDEEPPCLPAPSTSHGSTALERLCTSADSTCSLFLQPSRPDSSHPPGTTGGTLSSAVSKWSIDSLDPEECNFSYTAGTPSYSGSSGEEVTRRDSLESFRSDSHSDEGSASFPSLPGGCAMISLASFYGFTPFTASVGTSYFARLAARDPLLRQAAVLSPEFAEYVRDVSLDPDPLQQPIGSSAAYYQCQGDPAAWLKAVHLTCILLAAKVVDTVPYRDLHRVMLAHSCSANVSSKTARLLEVECLEALHWRLGPFFAAP